MSRKFFTLTLVPLLACCMLADTAFAKPEKQIPSTEAVIEDEDEDEDEDEPAQAEAAITVDDDSPDAQALSLQIEQSGTSYRKAYAAYEDEKYELALKHIEKAIALYPEHSNHYDLKAYILIKMQDYVGAMGAIDAGLTRAPNDPSFYELKANTHYQLKQIDLALAAYRKMLEYKNDFDGHPEARWYRNYLEVLSEEKLLDESHTVYTTYLQSIADGEVIEDDDNMTGDLHFYASLAYNMKGNTKAEMRALNAAIAASPDYAGYYNNRGNLLDEMQQYTEALADFNKGIALDKKSGSLYYNRGSLYSKMKNYQQALQDLVQAQKLGIEDEKLYLSLGNTYKGLEKYPQSLAAYRSVLAINPKNKQVQNNIALLYKLINKPELANNAYQQAISSDHKVEIPLYNQSNDLMRTGNYKEAITLLKKAIQAKPDFTDAYNQLGICYDELEQHELALETYSKGLSFDDKNATLYINRANTYKMLGKIDLAKNDYLAILKFDPSKTIAYYTLAKMYDQQDQVEQANQYYQLAKEANVSAIEYFVDYGAFLLNTGKPEDAMKLIQDGLLTNRDNYQLLVNLANAYAELGEHKKNEVTLKKAISIEPKDFSAYHNLGNHYFTVKKDFALAEKYYLMAIDRNPSLTLAYLNLASVYSDSGKKEQAFSVYKKLLNHDPNSYEAYYNRAAYQMRLGMSDEAISDFDKSFAMMNKALEKQKHNPYQFSKLKSEQSLLKAQAYQELKNYEQANSAYEAYLNFNTKNANAYNNYAYCLLEMSKPQKALDNFEKSHQLNNKEIDNIVGLIATNYLLNNKAAISKYKFMIKREFNDYTLDANLLEMLSQRGYSYTDTFKRIWKDMMAK
jgi:tetratricopeptide (TPR) repeat protein